MIWMSTIRPFLNRFLIAVTSTCVFFLVILVISCDDVHAQAIGRWIFDPPGVSGNMVLDRAGVHDGTIQGSYTIDTINNALVLNGVDTYVALDETGIPASLPTRDITLEAWVLVNSPVNWAGIINYVQYNALTKAGWVLGQFGGSFIFGLSTGSFTYLIGARFDVGKWYHVVGAYDGSTMKLYVNGRLTGVTYSRTGNISYQLSSYRLGSYWDDDETYYWDGKIHEVAIYDVALTYDNILANFLAKKDVYGATLLPPVLPKGPYLIYPGINTQMLLMWQLVDTQSCTLEWGTDMTYSDGSVVTTEYGIDHQHSYLFTGLVPGTKYYYRITDAYFNTYTGSFYAAPPDSATSVKFLGYGDVRTYPYSHDVVCAKMVESYTLDPGFQTFTLLSGDWTTNDTESVWATEFFNMNTFNARELQANLPISGCRGNHELSGLRYLKYYPYPYVSDFYWSFDYGPVHVAVVDQYVAYDNTSPQYAWLENDLATTTKPWKIIQFHEPAYTAGGHVNNIDAQNYLHSLAVTYNVAIMFTGHNHYYSRCDVDGVKHITSGGGGAPLYPCDPGQPYVVTCTMAYHYCEFVINGNTLDFTAIGVDGTVIDSFTIVASFTPTPTSTPTSSPTITPTYTTTFTSTMSPTAIPTSTPTGTPTSIPSPTSTATPTLTPTPMYSPTNTHVTPYIPVTSYPGTVIMIVLIGVVALTCLPRFMNFR